MIPAYRIVRKSRFSDAQWKQYMKKCSLCVIFGVFSAKLPSGMNIILLKNIKERDFVGNLKVKRFESGHDIISG